MTKLEVRDLSIEYTMKRSHQHITAPRGISLPVDAADLATVVGPTVFQSPALLSWHTMSRNVICGLALQGISPRQATSERAGTLTLTHN